MKKTMQPISPNPYYQQVTYGYLTIIEDASNFIFQQSRSDLVANRYFLITFCSAVACLFSLVLAQVLPVWICAILSLLVALYASQFAPRIYSQPFIYFTIEKQPAQINVIPKRENTRITLKREETYVFYVWLTSHDEHEEAIFHIDNNDQKTTLLEQNGYGDNARQIALFLGNLWDKPVMLRDENGNISQLSSSKKPTVD